MKWTDDLTEAAPADLEPLVVASIAEDGPAQAFNRLSTALSRQEPALRGQNVPLLALTGDLRCLHWMSRNLASPVKPTWGTTAALLGVEWPMLQDWLERGPPHSLMALDALLAYRRPADDMAPLHQGVAPVLPNPPDHDALEAVLAAYLEGDDGLRPRQAVDAIRSFADEILRGGAPTVPPEQLPHLVLAHAKDRLDYEAYVAHLVAQLGPGVCYEDASAIRPIDIWRFPPTESRPFDTLVTVGMSAEKMNIPTPAVPDRMELILSLPPGWIPEGGTPGDNPWSWPVFLLRALAHMPFEYDSWLGEGHTVGPFPERFPGSYADTVMFFSSLLLGPGLRDAPVGGDQTIPLFAVYFLHPGEVAILKDQGLDTLLARFDAKQVSEVYDPSRPDSTA